MDLKANSGFCHTCRKTTSFVEHGEWLRDHYLCSGCGSIPRQRHVQWVLDKYFPGWEGLTIHESSPSNHYIAQLCPAYSVSQYFEKAKKGRVVNGTRCEDLESLTFADETFDLFITQDVFEHIFHPDQAAREIMRVLKPGGAHIFTAPKHKGLMKSYPRARLSGVRVEYLMEEVYHGNPVGDGKALVTWDYGDDFEFLMNRWCHYPTVTYLTRDRELGLDGEFLEVFVTRKILHEPAILHDPTPKPRFPFSLSFLRNRTAEPEKASARN